MTTTAQTKTTNSEANSGVNSEVKTPVKDGSITPEITLENAPEVVEEVVEEAVPDSDKKIKKMSKNKVNNTKKSKKSRSKLDERQEKRKAGLKLLDEAQDLLYKTEPTRDSLKEKCKRELRKHRKALRRQTIHFGLVILAALIAIVPVEVFLIITIFRKWDFFAPHLGVGSIIYICLAVSMGIVVALEPHQQKMSDSIMVTRQAAYAACAVFFDRERRIISKLTEANALLCDAVVEPDNNIGDLSNPNDEHYADKDLVDIERWFYYENARQERERQYKQQQQQRR